MCACKLKKWACSYEVRPAVTYDCLPEEQAKLNGKALPASRSTTLIGLC